MRWRGPNSFSTMSCTSTCTGRWKSQRPYHSVSKSSASSGNIPPSWLATKIVCPGSTLSSPRTSPRKYQRKIGPKTPATRRTSASSNSGTSGGRPPPARGNRDCRRECGDRRIPDSCNHLSCLAISLAPGIDHLR